MMLLTAFAACAIALHAVEAADECGRLIRSIDFEGHEMNGEKLPYVEELAYQDWAPYKYLDGFHGDEKSRNPRNKRVFKVQDGDSTALEVLLPEGCVTASCAMQVKTSLLMPVDSATLKFRLKFGPDFDWVRGGKLPGLCGAGCLTGCKPVSGLDGFSSRQMWRPCVWPPEHPDNEINCTGGKLVAYVYHMFKEHWCGDDIEYTNSMWHRQYDTARQTGIDKNFFQPHPEEWYTIWSHVAMNTAGPPGEPAKFEDDGVLQTWLQGPGFGPVLVVDKHDMSWRQYNNVTIDTVYFSVFFGGSSETFQAKKDETIKFDDFQVWEGLCSPDKEPFPSELFRPPCEWPSMRPPMTSSGSVLEAAAVFEKAFVGGGCAKFEITKTVEEDCTEYHIELHIRPSWGTLKFRHGVPTMHGVSLIDSDESAGWFLLKSEAGSRKMKHNEPFRWSGVCVRNYEGARYLPEDINSHVTARAFCSASPAVDVQGDVDLPTPIASTEVGDTPTSSPPPTEEEEDESKHCPTELEASAESEAEDSPQSAEAKEAEDCVKTHKKCFAGEGRGCFACCSASDVCMKKNDYYGKCVKEGSVVPSGWDGAILEFSQGCTAAAADMHGHDEL